ncbi:MAG: hypothetical protein IPI04_16115 [Ignavibacteria bacterium]|nr:hypothetical protein [Ignavibacteria bacterium]
MINSSQITYWVEDITIDDEGNVYIWRECRNGCRRFPGI